MGSILLYYIELLINVKLSMNFIDTIDWMLVLFLRYIINITTLNLDIND